MTKITFFNDSILNQDIFEKFLSWKAELYWICGKGCGPGCGSGFSSDETDENYGQI